MLHKRSISPLAGNDDSLKRSYKVANQDQDKPEMGASAGNRSLSDRDMNFELLDELV